MGMVRSITELESNPSTNIAVVFSGVAAQDTPGAG